MTLDAHEFIRRFLLHVLPRGYVRIRHHGLMAHSNVRTRPERARELLKAEGRGPILQVAPDPRLATPV